MRRKEAGFIAAQAAVFVAVIALVSLPLQSTSGPQVSTSSAVAAPLAFTSGISPQGLQLRLTLNSSSIRSHGAISGKVEVLNTLDRNVSLSGLMQNQNISEWNGHDYVCDPSFFVGFGLFRGHFYAGNISAAGPPLQLAPPVAIPCAASQIPGAVTFLPDGDQAVATIDLGQSPQESYPVTVSVNATTGYCTSVNDGGIDCFPNPGLVGYWNGTIPGQPVVNFTSPAFVYFPPGEYTIAATDLWNQYVYATFVVERSTVTSLTGTYVNGSSGLSLYLGINSTVLATGQNLSVLISEHNSANTPQNVSAAAHWPTSNLTLYPCGRIGYPFGVAVLKGNYEEGNLSLGTTLQIVEGGSQSCPSTPSSNSYYFETHSDNAAFSGDCTPSSVSCGQYYYMSQTIAITGYWTGGVPVPMEPLTRSVLHPLQPGEYTVVGGDEWGTEVILHFVVQG